MVMTRQSFVIQVKTPKHSLVDSQIPSPVKERRVAKGKRLDRIARILNRRGTPWAFDWTLILYRGRRRMKMLVKGRKSLW